MATDVFTHNSLVAHENLKNAHRNTQKSQKNSKHTIHNVFSTTGMNFPNCMTFFVLIGRVRFARYYGKMYSRHLVWYSRLKTLAVI